MQHIKNTPQTRTLLIYNFKNKEELKYFKSILKEQIICETYSIPQRLNLFITFYDIRNSILFSQRFKDPSCNFNLFERAEDDNTSLDFLHLNSFFTISKNEIQKGNEEVTDKNNQSSMIIYFKNVDNEISDKVFMSWLRNYGEVKDIRLSKPFQKIVEFYDMREAKKVFDELNGTPFQEGYVVIYFVWDTMLNYKNEIIRRTDEILRKIPIDKDFTVETNEVKRQKLEEPVENVTEEISHNKPAINTLLDIFDLYIFNNLDEIETIFK